MDMSFNVMGIDPGSRVAGVSIYNIEIVDTDEVFKINSVKTFNLMIDDEKDIGIHENILDRANRLSTMVKLIYSIYNPVVVAMESAFIHMSRMGAVIPLARTIHTIESTLYGLDKYLKIISIPPGVIKKVFDSTQQGKEAVKKALYNKPMLLSKVVDKDITEHEIDAIAVGYTIIEYLKKSKGMTCIKYLEM